MTTCHDGMGIIACTNGLRLSGAKAPLNEFLIHGVGTHRVEVPRFAGHDDLALIARRPAQ